MIIDSKKFNVNDSYSTFLPPLPYLLRTHFDFLKKKYFVIIIFSQTNIIKPQIKYEIKAGL